MHFVEGAAPPDAIARGRIQYLRAEPTLIAQRDISDEGMSQANVLIRLEGSRSEPLRQYEQSLRAVIDGRGTLHARMGVHKPRSYVSHAMTQFAYAHALPPTTGTRHPYGVVTPQSKTPEWWAMDWMRRETYFLPQYDPGGRMLVKGQALASAVGIPCINRRLYHNAAGYGFAGTYDFIGYFEFAQADADVFRAVMSGLRDRVQNPEWNFVREGPEWWGRRLGRPEELWT